MINKSLSDKKASKGNGTKSIGVDASESDVASAISAGHKSGIESRSDPAESAGISAATSIVKFKDGSAMVHKQFSPGEDAQKETAKEVVAGRLSKIVGAGAPTVIHDPGNPAAILQPFSKGEVAAKYMGRSDFTSLQNAIDSDKGKSIALLDHLINNEDRNSGNWLINNGVPVPIDHGGAFNPAGTSRSIFAKTHKMDSFDPEQLHAVQSEIQNMPANTPAEKEMKQVVIDRLNRYLEGGSML